MGDEAVISNEGEVRQPAHNEAVEGLAAVWVDPHSGAELPLFDGVLPPPPDADDGEDSADDSSLEDGSLEGGSQEGGGSVHEPTHEGEEEDSASLKSSASRSVPSLRSIGRLTIFANKFKDKSEGNNGTSEALKSNAENSATSPPKAAAPSSNLSRASAKEGESAGKKASAKDSWSGSLFGGGKSTNSKPTGKGNHDKQKKALAEPKEAPFLGPSELCVVLVEARGLEHPDRAQQHGAAGSSESSGDERPVSCSVVLQCNDQVTTPARP